MTVKIITRPEQLEPPRYSTEVSTDGFDAVAEITPEWIAKDIGKLTTSEILAKYAPPNPRPNIDVPVAEQEIITRAKSITGWERRSRTDRLISQVHEAGVIRDSILPAQIDKAPKTQKEAQTTSSHELSLVKIHLVRAFGSLAHSHRLAHYKDREVLAA
jgi:hypothetical protein